MFQYPNGLQCAVSEARVKAFEAIVPFIALVAALAGCIAISVKFFDGQNVLWSLAVVPWLWTAWVVLCAIATSKVFEVWCKPICE